MTLAQSLLWLYTLLVGTLFGGALFERLVLVSVWSSSPPESVREWNSHPRFKIDPSGRFFKFVTIPLMLLTPANAAVAWTSQAGWRDPLLLSTACLLVVIAATLAYFAPIIIALTYRHGEGMDEATIRRKVGAWVGWQYLRLALLLVGWVAAMRALQSST